MVSDPADIFFLNKRDLVRLGVDEDAAQGFVDSIEKGRHPEMDHICHALFTLGDVSDSGAMQLGLELGLRCNSIDDVVDGESLSVVLDGKWARFWLLPNDINNAYKLISDPETSKFLDKLKRGKVILPRKIGY